MRLVVNIPDQQMTPARANALSELVRRMEAEPSLINQIQAAFFNDETPRKTAVELAPETLSDAELAKLDALFPILDLMDDVTDEEWERFGQSVQEMAKEGLPARD